ncbi:unnamed protein product, partial [Iphiclides podalirius]
MDVSAIATAISKMNNQIENPANSQRAETRKAHIMRGGESDSPQQEELQQLPLRAINRQLATAGGGRRVFLRARVPPPALRTH